MKRRIDKKPLFDTVVVTGGLVLLVYWITLLGQSYAAQALLFAVFAGLVEYIDIALPEGSTTSAVSSIGIGAILVLPLPVAATAMVAGVSVARLLKDKKSNLGETLFYAAQTCLVVSLAGLFMQGSVYVSAGRPVPALLSAPTLQALAVCLVYFGLEVALNQFAFGLRRSGKFLPLFLGAVRFLGPIYLSLASIGLLMAVMYSSLGIWSAILFLVLLVVTRQSFSLYLDIRKTYRSTIAALATAIEAEAPHREGHGERVAGLAVKMGREIGLHGQQLERLGYAALLHDIGRLGIDEDSFDGLMESVNMESGEVQHAAAGADILAQVDFLKPAADLVRYHHHPISAKRTRLKGDDLLGARIINVASYFDELTESAAVEDRLRSREALARIRKDQVLGFDPKVVRTLGDILAKMETR